MNRLIFILLSILLFSCGNTLYERHLTEEKVIHATVGQELIDLKKALDSGAISQQEYEDLKEKTINRIKKRNNRKKKK